MVLDRNRLIPILIGLDKDLFENLHKARQKLQAEIDFLDSEQSRAEVIRAVSLKSPGADGMSGSSRKRDLSDLESMMEYYVREQKKVLSLSITQCMNRQLVAYHVFRAYLKLTDCERTILKTSIENSNAVALDILKDMKIQISQHVLADRKKEMIERILAEVNREIADIDDYDEISADGGD